MTLSVQDGGRTLEHSNLPGGPLGEEQELAKGQERRRHSNGSAATLGSSKRYCP